MLFVCRRVLFCRSIDDGVLSATRFGCGTKNDAVSGMRLFVQTRSRAGPSEPLHYVLPPARSLRTLRIPGQRRCRHVAMVKCGWPSTTSN
jgi:hypothetical protein